MEQLEVARNRRAFPEALAQQFHLLLLQRPIEAALHPATLSHSRAASIVHHRPD